VAHAKAGDPTVDFLAMRMAYLESPEFARGEAAKARVRELRQLMFAAMDARNHSAVRDRARETLALVYIDLDAQKAQSQACAALHDDACASRGKRVEMGLLKSIVSTGDGHSCASGWKVVTIDEEYFVLQMIDTKVRRQSIAQEGPHVCDKMEVADSDGQAQTYYFDIGAMLAAQERWLRSPSKSVGVPQ
jgi:hypothetical protein